MKLKTHTFIEFLASHSLLIKALNYLKREYDDSVYMYFESGTIEFLEYDLNVHMYTVKTWRSIHKEEYRTTFLI